MKKIFFAIALLVSMSGMGQTKFDHRKTFDPQFYPSGGTQYRSASGQPGPEYWQNRSDYSIRCTLDTSTHTVSGTVEITYTNKK